MCECHEPHTFQYIYNISNENDRNDRNTEICMLGHIKDIHISLTYRQHLAWRFSLHIFFSSHSFHILFANSFGRSFFVPNGKCVEYVQIWKKQGMNWLEKKKKRMLRFEWLCHPTENVIPCGENTTNRVVWKTQTSDSMYVRAYR